jgi:hypothetical protein
VHQLAVMSIVRKISAGFVPAMPRPEWSISLPM